MKYYISDLHFGHEKIIQYEHDYRPFDTVSEMNNEFIRRWNMKVKKGDEIYILGDFSFYHGEETNDILKQLNGMKFLIKGNHDHVFLADKDFDQSLFIWVKEYEVIKDGEDHIVLFHYPIQVWNQQHHGYLHFFGHIHSNTGTMHPMKYEIPNSYNVGIDILQEPMKKEEIIMLYERRKEV